MDMFHDDEKDDRSKALCYIAAAVIAIFLAGFASCANADCAQEETIGWEMVHSDLSPLMIYYDKQGHTHRFFRKKEFKKFSCDGTWRWRLRDMRIRRVT